jgi:hypothetical protein
MGPFPRGDPVVAADRGVLQQAAAATAHTRAAALRIQSIPRHPMVSMSSVPTGPPISRLPDTAKPPARITAMINHRKRVPTVAPGFRRIAIYRQCSRSEEQQSSRYSKYDKNQIVCQPR